MKAEEIKFTGELSDLLRNKIDSLFAHATSFDQIIDCWLNEKEHSLKILEGFNDEVENSDLICIVLSINGSHVAEIYFDRKDVIAAHPGHQSISRFLTATTVCGRPALETKDDELENWERSLGFEYSESLAGIIAAKQALIPYMMPYLMTSGGEISIRRSDSSKDSVAFEDYRTEIEDEGINVSQLLTVYSTVYGEVEQGIQPASFGCAYIRTDMCLPLTLFAQGICQKETVSVSGMPSILG